MLEFQRQDHLLPSPLSHERINLPPYAVLHRDGLRPTVFFFPQKMKPEPILEAVQIKLDEALALVNEAIRQIQGAREDAARMAARITIDTELLDLLAPKEDAK